MATQTETRKMTAINMCVFIPKPAAKAAEKSKEKKQPKAIKSKPKEPVELDLFGDNYQKNLKTMRL